ncbi:hypothetical protein Ahy_A09g043377 [Arachis hypogaea]|uniref:Uncharacterized protein n=1 Tax=Arachis hypogaea TaxID=3818 RepID=A0A445BI31_ARAHY|nr:hypothetical protein Ahy_A09g043377 [Arachis hypogaea]
MYEDKFGYVSMTCASEKSSKDILAELKTCFTNKHVVELDITSQEKIKYIELQITKLLTKKYPQTTNKGYVLAEYSSKIVLGSLDGEEYDSEDNLVDISFIGIDISIYFDLNKILEEDKETLEDHQRQDYIHAMKRCFNLNKKSWYRDGISDIVRREGHIFLTEYFLLGQYDVEEKF